MKEKKLTMIGNAHLDPVWLWNWQEGFSEVKATFRSALDRMKEYDGFVFTSAAASYYEWVEKNCPAMFEEIKQRVAEGRWEIVGGWWIQPDCNIPSGEGFARQGLYGQRYFLEKFGKMSKTGYNVDSFGHNGMLPQILKKEGMDNYVFMRPMPHEKGLPSRVFEWESADGSKVLTYRIPFEYCTGQNELRPYAERLMSELRAGEDALMLFYGVGNHGGGPTKEHIENILKLDADENMPQMKMGRCEDFFSEERAKNRPFPTVTGDLQHHASGCYAVTSKVKTANRMAEFKLTEAEGWSAIAKAVENQPYPTNLDEAWKGVLFNQFHDILAGTSIKSAYDDASYLYGRAMANGQYALNYALNAVSWDINIPLDTAMKPIVVFNSHGWDTVASVDLEMRGLDNDNFRLEDCDGNIIPAQRIQSEATVWGQSRLLFVAHLPAFGYKTYKLYTNVENAPKFDNVAVTETSIESDNLSFRLNPETGYVASLFDKKNNVEVLRGEGGKLNVIQDGYDTWAHNIFKFNNKIGEMQVVSMKVRECGPVRSTIRVKYKYNTSTVVEDFSVYREIDEVRVKVHIDWSEPSVALKLMYPVNQNFRTPTYSIPFGSIEKSANGEEEPGQTWFDFSGETYNGRPLIYGLAIANTAKYSYNFDISQMNMTLVRNAVYAHHDPKKLDPNEEYSFVDQGEQDFMYSLIPHAGTWKDAQVTKKAEELNVRPQTVLETFHSGRLPMTDSFASLSGDSDHIQISAIKESYDHDGIIVRMYETKGDSGSVKINLPFIGAEYDCSFTPCEIKTVKFPYDKTQPAHEVNLLEM